MNRTDVALVSRWFSGRLLLLLLALFVCGSQGRAQRPQQLRVAASPAFSGRALVPSSGPAVTIAPSYCTEDRLIGIGVGATLGAGAGWLMYELSIGAFSSSRATASGRQSARWVLGGAVVGALWGALAPSPHRECR